MADDRAFEESFDDLFAAAMRPAMRILRSVEEAEDVAAEVLARMYVDRSRVVGQPWSEAWAVRSATNLAIDRVRRRSRSVPALVAAPTGELELRLDLADAVARLPRRQREAISLRFFGDLPEADVAALMSVSVGSVKRHVHRGLSAMREGLGDAWLHDLEGLRP